MTSADKFIDVRPAACAHIADYYAKRQEENPCLGNNLLRRGYAQWARGNIEKGCNNLFGSKEKR